MPEKQLSGEILKASQMDQQIFEDMFRLMSIYYENVSKENFWKDLFEKDATILLRDKESGELKGFSTLKVLEALVKNHPNRALFSGDTVIDKAYWGGSELPRMWLKYAFQKKEEASQIPFYWFLMSKGYKTYRFLPVFFNDFYPKFNGSADQDYKSVLDTFAALKFPNNYQPERGLIVFQGKDRLKRGIADIDEKRMRDEHIRYFTQINPKWAEGDELACITRIDRDNLKCRACMLLDSK